MKSRVLGLSLAAFLSMTAAAAAADVNQTAVNTGNVVNASGISTITGSIVGTGNSASLTSTGALSQLSVMNPGILSFNISGTQFSMNSGSVSNGGTVVVGGTIAGLGNSVSIAATGAAAAASITAMADPAVVSTIGGSGSMQYAFNSGAFVLNQGSIVAAGGLSGINNGLSISATGALAQASISAPGGHIEMANISAMPQFAANSAVISNQGTITTGALTGFGNSASIAATGAAAAASISTSVGSLGTSGVSIGGLPNFATNVAVAQNVLNSGAVNNVGTIAVSGLNGTGNSASISATGALAQASISSVGGAFGTGTSITGTQTATNTAAISNGGTIVNAGGLIGSGNSLSVSAVGAAVVASYSSIR